MGCASRPRVHGSAFAEPCPFARQQRPTSGTNRLRPSSALSLPSPLSPLLLCRRLPPCLLTYLIPPPGRRLRKDVCSFSSRPQVTNPCGSSRPPPLPFGPSCTTPSDPSPRSVSSGLRCQSVPRFAVSTDSAGSNSPNPVFFVTLQVPCKCLGHGFIIPSYLQPTRLPLPWSAQ